MLSEMTLYKRVWHPVPKIIKVGEWKRAYSIHEYFMENTTRTGTEHPISWNVMEKLRELCHLVLAHRNFPDFQLMANMYLPNTYESYGEYYKFYLEDTIKIIDALGAPSRKERLIYKEN